MNTARVGVDPGPGAPDPMLDEPAPEPAPDEPAPAPGLDDATLVARARERDVAAFEALVRAYQRRIYGLCLRMLGSPAEAQDVVQEIFLTAWRRLPEIQTDGAFGGWLYRSATNRCLNVLRLRKPTVELDENSTPIAPGANPHGDPERSAQNQALMAALTIALGRLPPTQRACWLLREVHGQSYDEIARTVGASAPAVRGRIARARIELAEAMAPWR